MSGNTELHTASIRLAEATRYFSMAYAVGVTDQMDSLRDAWRTQAIEYLQSAADALGFELVEKQPLIVMSKDTFMDKINAATKTIPVSELMHGTSNANDLMSDALGNVVGPR